MLKQIIAAIEEWNARRLKGLTKAGNLKRQGYLTEKKPK